MRIDAHRPAVAAPPMAAVRALLVDRDDDTREMYAEYMRLAAYDVEQASDGRDALAIAMARRPQIVITETQLPGIDGFDLCRLLRADDATRDTPIVVVTGDSYAPDIQRARDAGATEVLIKPCLPEVLLAATKRLLQISHAIRDRADKARAEAAAQIERSQRLGTRVKRRSMVERFNRRQTDAPPLSPPALACPHCETPLAYERSHIGGVSEHNSEQWDYFRCPRGCGEYQYRHRTRKVRKVR
jgi:DNA-binding response OmpR family regulator